MGEARQSHHRRWTRLMRLPVALGMGLVLAGAGDPARTAATVSTAAQQTLRGWGMSLAWEANVIHGGPFCAARIPDPAEQRRTMDLLFGNPARGANVFGASSNSAPWWMTASGCASGAERGGEDSLRADAAPAFAACLAAVVGHFRRKEGITFGSFSPLNEPDGACRVAGSCQEGSCTSLTTQEAVIATLARALAGTGAAVSGTEANSMDAMTGYLAQMGAASLDALGQPF